MVALRKGTARQGKRAGSCQLTDVSSDLTVSLAVGPLKYLTDSEDLIYLLICPSQLIRCWKETGIRHSPCLQEGERTRVRDSSIVEDKYPVKGKICWSWEKGAAGREEELPRRRESRAQPSGVSPCRLGKNEWSHLPGRGRSTEESPDARERMFCPSIPG